MAIHSLKIKYFKWMLAIYKACDMPQVQITSTLAFYYHFAIVREPSSR